MSRAATPDELQLASRLLPGLDTAGARVEEGGQFHRVLVLAPHAAIRMARTAQVSADMPRNVALHQAVADLLPIDTPRPLGPITEAGGLGNVAMSFIPGSAHPPHSGDPLILRRIVRELAAVDIGTLEPLLAAPFAFRGEWTEERIAATHDALPGQLRGPARTLWDQLPMLAGAPRSLVHGDLAGHNMHWVDGQLAGILDWDLAAAWDPALNTAYLALWHGQEMIEQIAPDTDQAHRARIWLGLMSLERFSDTISRTDSPNLGKLLRKIGPRILRAAADCSASASSRKLH
ncbi:aminoglycoside phosphotransferase family protein [Glutamicibacter sp. MNS18]|uniref:phosphotransferase family protein n=1 Tax=Glutamicibacter sp. MNS18 TaxID=2989817 RepID=UPI0022368C6F|nr:aminoglycoside phosphotransferase family protein [Glutamicibacter sp. MNS18]MCW4465183.1 aminoglycoside phosphotransferase family protein [Glutamicibacter sp. MNS18]